MNKKKVELDDLGSFNRLKSKGWPKSSCFDILERGSCTHVFPVLKVSCSYLSRFFFSGVFRVFGELHVVKTT